MSSFLRLAGPSFVSSHSWILSERELSGGIEIDDEESIDDDESNEY
jgi:hypothetical protein